MLAYKTLSCRPTSKRKRNTSGFIQDEEEIDSIKDEQVTLSVQKQVDVQKLTKHEIGILKDEGCRQAELGNSSEALKIWQRALNSDPFNAVLNELMAQVYLEQGKFTLAINASKSATSMQPDWADGHLTLARSYREFGEINMSLESYRTAAKLSPGNEEIALEMNEMLSIEKTSNELQTKYSKMLAESKCAAEEEVARCFLNLCARASVSEI